MHQVQQTTTLVTVTPAGAYMILGGNDARCVIEISEGESLEILYTGNIMQQPVGHDQRADNAAMTQRKGGISVSVR